MSALALGLSLGSSTLAESEPPTSLTPAPLGAISCPTKVQIVNEARYSFGHSAASLGSWLFVGTTGEISRYRRVEVGGRPSFRYETTFAMPSPAAGFHSLAVGMWIAGAKNHLYAGRGKQPSTGPNEYYSSSDIAHFIVNDAGQPEFMGWLGVPGAGVVRSDGSTLVAPLPNNGWPAAPTTPGILVCPLGEDGAPGTPTFVPIPDATNLCRAADVSGDWIAVGVPNATVDGLLNVGRVAILHRDREAGWQVTQWIDPPVDSLSVDGRFGNAVAIDGQTLVVGAPETLHDNISLRGAAMVYRLDQRGMWSLHSTVAPAATLDYTGFAVEVAGDLVAVGAPGKRVAYPGDGNARLFRVQERGLEPLMHIDHGWFEPNMGRSVLLFESEGDAHFVANSGPSDTGGGGSNDPITGSILHLRNLSEELADCDADGLPDGAAIDEGIAADCNDDRVPDTCQDDDCDANGVIDVCDVAPLAAFDPVPDPPATLLYGWTQPAALGVLEIQRLASPEGSSGIVRALALTIGRLSTASTVTFLLYADPNQDGDPADATLLRAMPLDVWADQPLPALVEVPPTLVGAPGTIFFAGLLLSGPHLQPLKFDEVATGSFFYVDGPIASIDVEHPTATEPFVPYVGSNGSGLRMMLTPLFGAVADVNGDRVPDACDCPGDLDGSGNVDASDLAIVIAAWGEPSDRGEGSGDVDGDGVVGAIDLGLLLAMWGGC